MPNVIGPSFLVSGIAPPDVSRAPMARRRAFWGAVATYVLEAKERELRAGLDRFGNPLAHLAQSTIKHRKSEVGPAHAYAPPLMPAYKLSRTRSLFTAEPNDEATGVLCWWLYDAITGASWGEILEKHRTGSARLPVRDVIGLTPASLAKVKQQATRWWESGREKVPVARPTGVEPGVTHALPTGEWRRNLPPGTKGIEWLKPSETGVPRTMAAPARSVQTFRIGQHTYTLQGGLTLRPPSLPKVFPLPPAPKPITIAPGDFTTHDHVKQFLKTTLPNAVTSGIERIPVDVWNAYSKEIDVLAKKFPEVASRLKLFSTRWEGWDAPNAPHKNWAAAGDSASGKMLLINPSKNQDLADVEYRASESARNGFWPKGANAVSTITHEWGHLVDAWIKQESTEHWTKIREMFLKPEPNPNMDVEPVSAVSVYAATSHKEAVAEAFSAYRWTPKDQKTNTLLKFQAALNAAIKWIREKTP